VDKINDKQRGIIHFSNTRLSVRGYSRHPFSWNFLLFCWNIKKNGELLQRERSKYDSGTKNEKGGSISPSKDKGEKNAILICQGESRSNKRGRGGNVMFPREVYKKKGKRKSTSSKSLLHYSKFSFFYPNPIP
jgi:hypothetical protein